MLPTRSVQRTVRTLFKADEFYEDFERNYPDSITIVLPRSARRVPGLASIVLLGAILGK